MRGKRAGPRASWFAIGRIGIANHLSFRDFIAQSLPPQRNFFQEGEGTLAWQRFRRSKYENL